jgi:hypothetical protein
MWTQRERRGMRSKRGEAGKGDDVMGCVQGDFRSDCPKASAAPAKQMAMFMKCNCTWKMEGETKKMQLLILRIPTWMATWTVCTRKKITTVSIIR